MPQLSVVGTDVPRVEGRDKVTGASVYAVDVSLPGMLWVKVRRSTVPHALLRKVDTSAALALPGVRAVLTGADLGGVLTGGGLRDMPVLCTNRVRYVGDPIAAVAAESPKIADEAVGLIEVEYEELPGVFGMLETLESEAPRLHPERASYSGSPDPKPGSNVQGSTRITKGDVAQGFSEADLVFEHTFHTSAIHQGYIEPRACVVHIEDDGTLRVWSSCQSPYPLRDLLASVLGLALEKVVVERTSVGGSFGGKGSVGPEPMAYFLARATGCPVKYVPTYTEELLSGSPRHPAAITMKTGVNRDGTLVARSARILMDGGAYAAYKTMPNVVLPSVARVLGPYRIPHTEIDAQFLYTNNTPAGIARAPAQPQMVFAGESQIDIIADALGLDPLELRLRNVVGEGEIWPHNGVFEGVMTRETLELLRTASSWDTPLGPNQGRGMAMTERGIGAGASGMVVTLRGDGTAEAVTGIVDVGTGAHTIIRQIVAEEMHLPLAAVRVTIGSTEDAPYDSGIGGSKHTFSLTMAAVDVTQQLLTRLRPVAAQRLECSEEDLELVGQAFQVRGHAGLSVPVQQVAMDAAERAGGALVAESAGPGKTDRAPQSCIVAYAVDVEVDPASGQVRVLKVAAVHDVGRAINPRLLQAQIDGATVQGLGQALMEDLSRADGRTQASHLGEYKLPSMADVPPMVSVFVEGAPGPAPYAAKAVAELSLVPIPAAVANAVARACGARVTTLPVTAERVLAALPGRPTAAAATVAVR